MLYFILEAELDFTTKFSCRLKHMDKSEEHLEKGQCVPNGIRMDLLSESNHYFFSFWW